MIEDEETAEAERPVGTVGAVVSVADDTVTVVLAVTEPWLLVAVRVYVVVTVGDTLLEMPVTVPTFWLMDKDVALETLQDKVEELPLTILEGEAEKDEITGAEGVAACVVAEALEL